MPEAVYVRDGNGRYVSTPLAAGPWDPNGQHAGASAALLAHVMEQHDLPPGTTPFLARVTVDLIRPAPVATLEVGVRTVRAGRRAHWLDAVLTADGREVAHASGVRILGEPVPVPDDAHPVLQAPPAPATVPSNLDGRESPWLMFWHGIDVRPYKGEHRVPGPGGAWFNQATPLIAGIENTPLIRAVSASDFALGISQILDFERFSFPNADLTVHLIRYPVGPWVALDSVTWVDGDAGTGMAEGELWDEHGRIGRVAQSLVVGRRPEAP